MKVIQNNISPQNILNDEKEEKVISLSGDIDYGKLGETIHGHEKVDKGTSRISITSRSLLPGFYFFIPCKPCKQKQIEVLIQLIQTNQHVTSLSISYFEIKSKSIQLFAKFLKTNTTLTSLSLRKNKLRGEGAKYIADALKLNKSIISLDLSGSDIGNLGVKYIIDALKVNKSIISLNFSKSNIGAVDAKYIALILKMNSSLTSLNLSSNYIRAVGVKYIAEALRKNTAITSLNLEDNSIEAVGVKYIAEVLEENTSLTSLNFTENAIGAAGTKYIADALKLNKSIISLNLSRNVIGVAGAKYIAEALEKNTSLTSLDLSENTIGRTGDKHISDALKENITLTSIAWLRYKFSSAMFPIDKLVKRNKGYVYSLKKAVEKGNRSKAEKLIKTGISPLSGWKDLQSQSHFIREFQSSFSFAVDKKNYPMIDLFLSKGFSLPESPSTKGIRISVGNLPRFFEVIDTPFKTYGIAPDLVDIILSYSFDTSSPRCYIVEIRKKTDKFLSLSLE